MSTHLRAERSIAARQDRTSRGGARPHPLIELQALAGNRAVTELLGHGPQGGGPRSAPVLQRKRRPATARRPVPAGASSARGKAAALGAPDAASLVAEQLPALAGRLGAEQLGRVQAVIDAAAVNPAIEAEVAALEAHATRQYGSLVVRDEGMGRRADRARERLVKVGEQDRRIRLDHRMLLEADVFPDPAPSPDDARFQRLLRRRLETAGIWLRVNDHRIVRAQGGARVERTATPELWLSLGRDGDAIPAPGGRVDREALLGTTSIGALYYTTLYMNPGRVELDRLAEQVQAEIVAGATDHGEEKARRDNPLIPYAPEIAEWLGDAEFPNPAIWDVAWTLYRSGSALLLKDQVDAARPFLLAAAEVTRSAAMALVEYEEQRSTGAKAAVKWLRRVKTAAIIVGSVLGAAGVVRGGVAAVRAAATKEVARAAPGAQGWVVSGAVEGESVMYWRWGTQGAKSAAERGHVAGLGQGQFF